MQEENKKFLKCDLFFFRNSMIIFDIKNEHRKLDLVKHFLATHLKVSKSQIKKQTSRFDFSAQIYSQLTLFLKVLPLKIGIFIPDRIEKFIDGKFPFLFSQTVVQFYFPIVLIN